MKETRSPHVSARPDHVGDAGREVSDRRLVVVAVTVILAGRLDEETAYYHAAAMQTCMVSFRGHASSCFV